MTYRNTFETGPATFTTSAKPHRYRGFLLYNRLPGTVCDIVKGGACVGMCVTVRGAKRHIDDWKRSEPF